MSIERFKHTLTEMDPLLLDTLLAVGLALLAVLQIIGFWNIGMRTTSPMGIRPLTQQPDLSGQPLLPMVVAALAFVPLAFRRRYPAIVLFVVSVPTVVYLAQHWPPAMVTLAPMLALYTLATLSERRGTALVGLLVAGMIVGVSALVMSSSRAVAEIVSLFALLAASAFLGDTTRNRRRYMREMENRALEAERTREEEALRRAAAERVRIARDVHDLIAHNLTIVTVQADAGLRVFGDHPEQAREALRHISTTGRSALRELRGMLDVMRTGNDSAAPLVPTADLSRLDNLAASIREAGVDVEVQRIGDLENLPMIVGVSAFAIIQEALTNVVRHANAQHACVIVRALSDRLEVTVTDDGTASSSTSASASRGHGIMGMRERVNALGGTFEAAPLPAGGFAVNATFPSTRRSM